MTWVRFTRRSHTNFKWLGKQTKIRRRRPSGGRPRVVCFLRLVTVVALYLYLNASLLLLLSLVYNVQFLVPTTTSWTFSNLLVLAQYDSLVILTQAIPQFLWWSMVWAEITSVTDNCYAHPDDEIVRCWLFYSFLSTGWPSYFSFRFKSYLLFAASTILDVYTLRILLFPNTFEFPPPPMTVVTVHPHHKTFMGCTWD